MVGLFSTSIDLFDPHPTHLIYACDIKEEIKGLVDFDKRIQVIFFFEYVG